MYRTEARECVVSHDLQTYFRDINEVSLLSAEEERELSEAISRGDEDARTRMIGANLRLVVRIARDYLGRGLVLDDLIGEGNIGLIRAVSEFDPRFGTRFSTYASYWIKQAIRHALINTTATIRLPAHMVGLLTRWRRAERLLTRERGQAPTFDEIAEHLELTETQKGLVAKARRANQLKLESGVGDDEEYWSPDDSIDPAVGPTTALESSDERSDVLRRLDCLDDRERLVVRLRYGLEGATPLTLKEIGTRLGITREWVRKIELRAVNKLETAAYATAAAPATTKPAASRGLAHRRSRQSASNSVRTAPKSRPMSYSARPAQVAAAC
ncbi:MAG: RNA polymerase sigma factor RpoD/SigA [Paludisphaera borealis]|uniref:sigma-70 family RNA polymerase sigma factor n=1 Tax=Paludisphaera borealis TaxID=1387353 RepID=UPI002845B75B|nr:RNA polymerase sigma factor RpoD/SigA [Paludisphaera borealis]MDR3619437.1 RNA polymerase sigma factor RpoD/SigA [Paludisphaera borealis]